MNQDFPDGLFELKPHPAVVQGELVDRPIRQLAGRVTVGDAPGLGIDVDRKVVERLAVPG